MSGRPQPKSVAGEEKPTQLFQRKGLKKVQGEGTVRSLVTGQAQDAGDRTPQPAAAQAEPSAVAASVGAVQAPAVEDTPVAQAEVAPTPAAEPASAETETFQPSAPAAPAAVQSVQPGPQAQPVAPPPEAVAAPPAYEPTVQAPPASVPQPDVAPQAASPVQNVQQHQPVPVPAPDAGGAAAPVQKQKAKPKKTTFPQTEEDWARMRNVYNALHYQEGYRTLPEFIQEAVDRLCRELEEKYNDGERYNGDPNAVPKGRPIGR